MMKELHGLVIFVLGIAIILYTFIGAVIFSALEGGRGGKVNANATLDNTTIRGLAKELHSIFLANATADYDQLISEVVRLLSATREQPMSSGEDPWNLRTGIFFSLTVITTIGYGNVSPVTPGGRVACVCYALLGIPVVFVFLAAIGGKMSRECQRVDPHMRKILPSDKLLKFVRLVSTSVIGIVFVMVLPALFFSHVEGWSFADAVYFTFVTLSTVGLGDIAPDSQMAKYNVQGSLFVSIWLFGGLAWFSLVLTTVQEVVTERVQTDVTKMMKRSPRIKQDLSEEKPQTPT